METITFYKHKPKVGVGIFRHVGYDDNKDFLFTSLLPSFSKNETPFSVRRVDVENQYEEVKDFNVEEHTKDRCTCGRRVEGFRGGDLVNMDYFSVRGNMNFPQCSYCGSCKFELFAEVIDKINEGVDGYGIEKATGKNYKYYLRTPQQDHIKFYTPHVPKEVFADEVALAQLNEKLLRACEISWDKFLKTMKNGVGS